MFTQIAPLAAIVAFWVIIFVASFLFSRRALHAPRGDEHEEAPSEHHESASSEVDHHVPSQSAH
ncbi:MAG TPA: hypothetical protein VFY89_01830 [Ktedonobacterales bacterium]